MKPSPDVVDASRTKRRIALGLLVVGIASNLIGTLWSSNSGVSPFLAHGLAGLGGGLLLVAIFFLYTNRKAS